MDVKFDQCMGCETQIGVDHIHQFVNFFGNVVETFFVDGICFGSPASAAEHVKNELGCTLTEAVIYIRSLKKKYN